MARGQRKSIDEKIREKEELIGALKVRFDCTACGGLKNRIATAGLKTKNGNTGGDTNGGNI